MIQDQINKKIISIILVIVLTIIFRIPFTPHEIGDDSFYIHWMSQSIIDEKEISWLLSPLSIFGLYPFSYPLSSPTIVSTLSIIFGMDVEKTILLYDIFLGLFGFFSAYSLAKAVFKDDESLALIVALFFVITPFFVNFTLWFNSTRNLFTAILPLFFWGLIKFQDSKNLKYIIFSFFITFFLASTHNLAIFTIPFWIGFIVFNLIENKKMSKVKNSNLYPITIITIFLVIFSIQIFNIGIYRDLQYNYQTGLFFKGSNPQIRILNMGIDYFGKEGIASFLAFFGLIFMFNKMRYDEKYNFFILSFLISSPGLILEPYFPLVILPIFVVFIGVGTKFIIFKSRIKYKSMFMSSLLLISIVFTCFMQYHWTYNEIRYQNKRWMEEKTFQSIDYLNTINTDNKVAVNDNVINRRTKPFLNEPTVPFTGEEFITHNKSTLVEISLRKADIGFWIRHPFSFGDLESPDITEINHGIIKNPISDPECRELINKYKISYGLINTNKKTKTKFFSQIIKERNNIYSNGKEEIYVI